MTLTEIMYFVEVAETLNYTRVAEKHFVVQQVVSKQVKKLEEDLGFSLFERNGRQLALTPSGEILYQFWNNMLNQQQIQIQRAKKIAQGTQQLIHVGGMPFTMTFDLIAEAISVSGQRNHDLQYKVTSAPCAELAAQLLEDKLDCIISLDDENTGMPGDYEEVILKTIRPCIVISENHPSYREGIKLTDLRDSAFYVLSSKASGRAEKYVQKHFQYAGFSPEMVEYFDDLTSMEMALYSGKGVAMTYMEFFRNPFGLLKAIPFEDELAFDNHITVMYHRSKKAYLREIVEILKEICDQ